MPAAMSHHRAFLLAASAIFFPLILAAFELAERPGLGIGHFYYLPVAMVALALGPRWGAAAGVAATGFYALGIVLNPHLPSTEVVTAGTTIRFVTYTTIGFIVGWFAQNNRALVERLRTAAEQDFLTGLLNTRAFDAELQARLDAKLPFGLILGDLDNLKEINDNEGHAVGNDVLRRAGQILACAMRREDRLARIGGDEFAVITSADTTDAVRALCDRLTAALGSERMSMSFGWALSPRDGKSPQLLFHAADERLYARKLLRRSLTPAKVVRLPSAAERRAELG
jgi:diguanylate cyclase (GGDEF)-like protein